MIKTLHIKNFKSLRDVRLELNSLNIFIGTNASGKSNIFDALRVLQGIGNGFTVAEVFDGKPRSATSEVWDGIRGGSSQAAFKSNPNENGSLEATFKEISSEKVSFEVETQNNANAPREFYKIGINTSTLRVTDEQFNFGGEVYNSINDTSSAASPVISVRYQHGKAGKQPHIICSPERPVLTQLAQGQREEWEKRHVQAAAHFARSLANMQCMDPTPSMLRKYSQAQSVTRMGERGENFAALIQTICNDPASKAAYISWLKQLRPSEVDDVGILKGAIGETMFSLKENGRDFPAPVLSDGTLRFAAITAAFFQSDMPELLTIEEIENGIHASRLRLLIELLRSRTNSGKTQVIATTHSPTVLAWLQEQEYKHTFFCKRDEKTGESKILPLTEIPNFNEIVKKQSIGDLFAEGWMEDAL
ncbi:MAG: AAA family ATPase [Puniceicoccales bacterium]|nr:AAA family ATPase [Puniceicoccales bacterium]